MVINSQIMPDKISAAATARLDREFTGRARNNWLRQFAGKIRLAIVWRIPVGFEDETGFHLGVQSARKDDRLDWERVGILADEKTF